MDFFSEWQYTAHLLRGMRQGFKPLTMKQFSALVEKINHE